MFKSLVKYFAVKKNDCMNIVFICYISKSMYPKTNYINIVIRTLLVQKLKCNQSKLGNAKLSN